MFNSGLIGCHYLALYHVFNLQLMCILFNNLPAMFLSQPMSFIVILNKNATKVTTSSLKKLKTMHMNTRLLFVALSIAGLSSCSTAYRTGQTPDDVYYSPERQQSAYVAANNSDESRRYNDNTSGSNYYESREDMYLRMMVRNRYRWSAFDNYYAMDSYYNPHMYYTNPWSYNYNPWSYSAFNNYYSWNSFYNPYCSNIVILNPVKSPTYYNKIKTFNLNAYNNNAYTNANATRKGVKTFNSPGINPAYGIPNNVPRYSNTNTTQRPLGTKGGKVYGTSKSRSYEYNSSSDRPVRSYTPTQSQSVDRSTNSSSGSSSGGSRSSGSSSSSSGSRPGRG
jgi:hypothetical protein